MDRQSSQVLFFRQRILKNLEEFRDLIDDKRYKIYRSIADNCTDIESLIDLADFSSHREYKKYLDGVKGNLEKYGLDFDTIKMGTGTKDEEDENGVLDSIIAVLDNIDIINNLGGTISLQSYEQLKKIVENGAETLDRGEGILDYTGWQNGYEDQEIFVEDAEVDIEDGEEESTFIEDAGCEEVDNLDPNILFCNSDKKDEEIIEYPINNKSLFSEENNTECNMPKNKGTRRELTIDKILLNNTERGKKAQKVFSMFSKITDRVGSTSKKVANGAIDKINNMDDFDLEKEQIQHDKMGR